MNRLEKWPDSSWIVQVPTEAAKRPRWRRMGGLQTGDFVQLAVDGSQED